jgi:uncharacterized membrane protein YeaQ/YmgE (transglycosylase-associated protein family)
MSIIVTIILGAIVGWIGSRLAGREEGFFGSMVIGIIGAIIGQGIARLFGSGSTSYLSLTVAGVVWSIVGAAIFAAILNAFSNRRSHHHV